MREFRTKLPNLWTPREYQLDLWLYLNEGGTRADVVAHRRWAADQPVHGADDKRDVEHPDQEHRFADRI